jgi:hypothetical protein
MRTPSDIRAANALTSALVDIAQDRGYNPDAYLGSGIGARARRFADMLTDPDLDAVVGQRDVEQSIADFLYVEGVDMALAVEIARGIMENV